MSENKKTIERYIDGFTKSNHKQILDCLTEDVVWVIPGLFHHLGKKAFDSEIENPTFAGNPEIVLTRLLEEDDVVVVEGTVKSMRRDGNIFNAAFCDIFEMENHKIKKLTGYITEIK